MAASKEHMSLVSDENLERLQSPTMWNRPSGEGDAYRGAGPPPARTPPTVKKAVEVLLAEDQNAYIKAFQGLSSAEMAKRVKELDEFQYQLQDQEAKLAKAGMLLGIHPEESAARSSGDKEGE